ncbi:MAG: phosphatidylserine decarboxylase family protein, partial [Flavobacteriia bacterium]|nr:phosphatidylserine decarboxylase family protein [Flavobacteriia bacterium]
MKLHREGFGIMITTLIIVVALSFLNFWFLYCNEKFIFYILIQLFLLVFLYLIVQFFRIPHRKCEFSEMDIVCP